MLVAAGPLRYLGTSQLPYLPAPHRNRITSDRTPPGRSSLEALAQHNTTRNDWMWRDQLEPRRGSAPTIHPHSPTSSPATNLQHQTLAVALALFAATASTPAPLLEVVPACLELPTSVCQVTFLYYFVCLRAQGNRWSTHHSFPPAATASQLDFASQSPFNPCFVVVLGNPNLGDSPRIMYRPYHHSTDTNT